MAARDDRRRARVPGARGRPCRADRQACNLRRRPFPDRGKLRPLGLLQRPDGTAPVVAGPNPLLALRMKLAVSNPASTRRLTAPFAWLFRPWVVVPMIVGFAITTWWVAFDKGLGSAAHDVLYRPALILVVLALTLLSAAFHEIGHAAACRYGGARPGRMGVGLYLVWPAFYTDVTDSYRLGRGGRLRVDLGGLYFNAIFAVATLGVWTLVHWDALLLVDRRPAAPDGPAARAVRAVRRLPHPRRPGRRARPVPAHQADAARTAADAAASVRRLGPQDLGSRGRDPLGDRRRPGARRPSSPSWSSRCRASQRLRGPASACNWMRSRRAGHRPTLRPSRRGSSRCS